MVTYCHESPKLCVGTKTGVLALYDLKSSKYQVRFDTHSKNKAVVSPVPLAISSSSEEWSDHLRRVFTRWEISCFVLCLWRDTIHLASLFSSFSLKISCCTRCLSIFRRLPIHSSVHRTAFIWSHGMPHNDSIVRFHPRWKKSIWTGLIAPLFACIGMWIRAKRNSPSRTNRNSDSTFHSLWCCNYRYCAIAFQFERNQFSTDRSR